MAIKDLLKPHRTWEDGLGLLLGVTIGLTPWLYEEASVPAVVVNSALTGLAVLVAQLACGLWLIASPLLFDYAHQHHLRFWHWGLGGIVSALAAFELWQDWDVVGRGR